VRAASTPRLIGTLTHDVTPWSRLVADDPALAAFAAERLTGAVAYLATIRSDGGPRLHPVSPLVRPSGLFVFMEPSSPKRRDLLRDPRYALHSGVEDDEGGGGEVTVWGRARAIDDPAERAAVASADTPARRVLFELTLERVVATTYGSSGPVRRRWSPPG